MRATAPRAAVHPASAGGAAPDGPPPGDRAGSGRRVRGGDPLGPPAAQGAARGRVRRGGRRARQHRRGSAAECLPGGPATPRRGDRGGHVIFEPTFLVTATFAADAVHRREPHRTAHLAHVRGLLADGTALLAGARADLSASVLVLRAPDAAAARALVAHDPYWRHRVWTALDVVDYLAATPQSLGRS
ncbi:hypothetical protein EYA84_19575 [Verrucosispora sp. SN26_14.1]|nr:hypothetical protein EYA84_19575 [Verrucosispora sp. SN26_14.1]